jgi:aspartyl-tRNA(Asn)/glutamyl-tRNA(Gln) amidotransferase subunit B
MEGNQYQVIIGLEIHVELKTKSKMFCSCLNDPDERHPNLNVCPICMGHPGTLPVINEEAIRKTIKTGLALNCQIPEFSKFDRKNYFYPDLPKGYQISQYDMPLCNEGFLDVDTSASSVLTLSRVEGVDGKKIRIRRVHLEEDTARLVHPVRNSQKRRQKLLEGVSKISNGVHEKKYSLVDFNRAGIPLMELVTEPELGSAEEARKFAEELHLIFHYLDVSDADMEKGQMRVEANISLSQNSKLGTKVEIKNLNSFRSLERALNYEIERQIKILSAFAKGYGGPAEALREGGKSGKKIIQETRGWDDIKGKTFSQREKEEAHDYRYFPEPDLPPLHITSQIINEIRAEIPELPQQKRERFAREYNLDKKEIDIFVYNKDLGEYFEKIISELLANIPSENLFKLIKLTSNYLITNLQGLLKGASVSGKDFLITPENFSEFINLIYDGKISSKIAKMVLEEMFKTGADPSHIIEEKGLIQITDETEIEKIIKEVFLKNQKAVQDYKKGKETALQFLIGQVMTESRGKANPEIVRKILKQKLAE